MNRNERYEEDHNTSPKSHGIDHPMQSAYTCNDDSEKGEEKEVKWRIMIMLRTLVSFSHVL